MAISPDGRILASGSWDGTVRLWNLATGEPHATLEGAFNTDQPIHQDESGRRTLAFSPDGRTFASGRQDGTVQLWHVATGKSRATLLAHTEKVLSVVFSPDGDILATLGNDGTVTLWDVATGHLRATLRVEIEGHAVQVKSVAFSPDSRTLATGNDDQTMTLWDVTTATPRVTLERVFADSIRFSPDGRTVATGGLPVKLWDVATGKPRVIPDAGGHAVFSPDGRTLVINGGSGGVQVCDVASGQLRTLRRSTGNSGDYAISPDGRTLAGARGQGVDLWDLATGHLRRTPVKRDAHFSGVKSVAFSPDGRTLATGYADGTVTLWDMTAGQPEALIWEHPGMVRSIEFSPDGRTLASTTEGDGTALLLDVATGRPRTSLGSRVTSVAFSPDGRMLVGSIAAESLEYRDATTGQSQRTPPGLGTLLVRCLSFSSDGRILAFLEGGTINLWNMGASPPKAIRSERSSASSVMLTPDGRTLAVTYSGGVGLGGRFVVFQNVATGDHEDTPWGNWDTYDRSVPESIIAFSRDGRTAASANAQGMVKLWNVGFQYWDVPIGGPKPRRPGYRTYELRATQRAHSGQVHAMAFSPDGRTLATGNEDGTVMLRDAATGQPRATFWGHTTRVSSLAFSPDGRTLASGGWDKTVRLWDVGTNRDHIILRNTNASAVPLKYVRFSRDGRFLETSREGDGPSYWDLQTGQPLKGLTFYFRWADWKSKLNAFALISLQNQPFTASCFLTVPPILPWPAPVSPDGQFEAKIDGPVIRLIDRHWTPPLQPPRTSVADLDPNWHAEQVRQCEQDNYWFAAAFHRGKLADLQPWDPSLRLTEAEAWAKAGQNQRAARAFVQAVLLDPSLGKRR